MNKLIVGLIFSISLCQVPTVSHADNQTSGRIILEGFVFDQGSSILKKTALPTLYSLLQELQIDPMLHIYIECHTTASGSAEKDLSLSSNRALIISDWFVAQGIDVSRIRVVGLGSTRPTAKDVAKVDPSQNKRLEIIKTPAFYPVALFTTTQYLFDPVVDGMEARHDFIVRNTGTAILKIHKVKTG
jgi:hypothetical protein